MARVGSAPDLHLIGIQAPLNEKKTGGSRPNSAVYGKKSSPNNNFQYEFSVVEQLPQKYDNHGWPVVQKNNKTYTPVIGRSRANSAGTVKSFNSEPVEPRTNKSALLRQRLIAIEKNQNKTSPKKAINSRIVSAKRRKPTKSEGNSGRNDEKSPQNEENPSKKQSTLKETKRNSGNVYNFVGETEPAEDRTNVKLPISDDLKLNLDDLDDSPKKQIQRDVAPKQEIDDTNRKTEMLNDIFDSKPPSKENNSVKRPKSSELRNLAPQKLPSIDDKRRDSFEKRENTSDNEKQTVSDEEHQVDGLENANFDTNRKIEMLDDVFTSSVPKPVEKGPKSQQKLSNPRKNPNFAPKFVKNGENVEKSFENREEPVPRDNHTVAVSSDDEKQSPKYSNEGENVNFAPKPQKSFEKSTGDHQEPMHSDNEYEHSPKSPQKPSNAMQNSVVTPKSNKNHENLQKSTEDHDEPTEPVHSDHDINAYSDNDENSQIPSKMPYSTGKNTKITSAHKNSTELLVHRSDDDQPKPVSSDEETNAPSDDDRPLDKKQHQSPKGPSIPRNSQPKTIDVKKTPTEPKAEMNLDEMFGQKPRRMASSDAKDENSDHTLPHQRPPPYSGSLATPPPMTSFRHFGGAGSAELGGFSRDNFDTDRSTHRPSALEIYSAQQPRDKQTRFDSKSTPTSQIEEIESLESCRTDVDAPPTPTPPNVVGNESFRRSAKHFARLSDSQNNLISPHSSAKFPPADADAERGENNVVIDEEKYKSIKNYLQKVNSIDEGRRGEIENIVSNRSIQLSDTSPQKNEKIVHDSLVALVQEMIEEKRALTVLCAQLLQQMQITTTKLVEIETRIEKSLIALIERKNGIKIDDIFRSDNEIPSKDEKIDWKLKYEEAAAFHSQEMSILCRKHEVEIERLKNDVKLPAQKTSARPNFVETASQTEFPQRNFNDFNEIAAQTEENSADFSDESDVERAVHGILSDGDGIKNRLINVSEEKSQLETMLGEKNVEIQRLKSELAQVVDEQAEFASQLSSKLTNRIEDLQSENSTLKTQLEELERRCNELASTLNVNLAKNEQE